jgi:hypothetical protein
VVEEVVFLLLLVGVWTARTDEDAVDDDGVDTLPEAMDSSEALDERKGTVDEDNDDADDEVLERLFTFIGLQLLNRTGNSLARRRRLASFSAALQMHMHIHIGHVNDDDHGEDITMMMMVLVM